MRLLPGDVLLFRPHYGILNPLVKLLINYGHVAIYFCETSHGLPLLIESIGRGVLIRSLYTYTGETVKVKRCDNPEAGLVAAKCAERLADNPASWYGYFDIPRFAIPKLIIAKFGALIPDRFEAILKLLAFTYRRNQFYICSELVASAYADAGMPIVPEDTIPLPDDIDNSPALFDACEFTVKY